MNYRPYGCMRCGGKMKKQKGGRLDPVTGQWIEDGQTYAMDQYQPEAPAPDAPTQDRQKTTFIQPRESQVPTNVVGMQPQAIADNQMQSQMDMLAGKDHKQNQSGTGKEMNHGMFGLQFMNNALSYLSNRMEMKRQNNYMYKQYATLGQLQPMPVNDYQPNPYNLYMRMGGNLKHYQKGGQNTPIYTNNPNDPKLKSYQDSLAYFNMGLDKLNSLKNGTYSKNVPATPNPTFSNTGRFDPKKRPHAPDEEQPIGYFVSDINMANNNSGSPHWGYTEFYMKPKQPIILQKPKNNTKELPYDQMIKAGYELVNDDGYHGVKWQKKNVPPAPKPTHPYTKSVAEDNTLPQVNNMFGTPQPINIGGPQGKSNYAFQYRDENGQQQVVYFPNQYAMSQFVKDQPWTSKTATTDSWQINAPYLKRKYGGLTNANMYDQGFTNDAEMDFGPHRAYKKGGWIQKAVNPDHKGFCTPLSNPKCTGHRRAFALMMKKKHGFQKD